MTKTAAKAAEIAHIYVDAMANKDIEKIVSISSSDVVCSSPLGKSRASSVSAASRTASPA